MIKSLKLPGLIWLVLLGTLLSRFGTSMVLPYITTILVVKKHIALFWPGLALGGSYLMQSLSSSFGARFYRRSTPIQVIQKFTYLYASVFLLLGCLSIFVEQKIWIVLGVLASFLMIGACRSFIETTGQTIISEVAPYDQKAFVFSLRYVFINVSTVLGPIVGFATGILNTDTVFFVTAIAVLAYAPLLKLAHHAPLLAGQQKKSGASSALGEIFQVLFEDKKLIYFTLASIFIYMGFSQLDLMFALLSYTYTHSNAVFVVMMAINGGAIVLLQLPLVAWGKRFNIHKVLLGGICLLSAGLVVIALAAFHSVHVLYYLGSFIFTLGEIFTLSLLGIYLDLIAPAEKRYAYFSIGNFSMLGRIIGPIISGGLCYWIGLRWNLVGMALITLIAAAFIYAALRLGRGAAS